VPALLPDRFHLQRRRALTPPGVAQRPRTRQHIWRDERAIALSGQLRRPAAPDRARHRACVAPASQLGAGSAPGRLVFHRGDGNWLAGGPIAWLLGSDSSLGHPAATPVFMRLFIWSSPDPGDPGCCTDTPELAPHALIPSRIVPDLPPPGLRLWYRCDEAARGRVGAYDRRSATKRKCVQQHCSIGPAPLRRAAPGTGGRSCKLRRR